MSALTVARTTLLRASRRPSTWAIAALSFLPALVGALSAWAGHGVLTVGAPVALRLVGPLMVPALVAAPVGEQFDNRTVVYWFTRPFARAWVLVGDALGYAVVAALALGLCGMLLGGIHALHGVSDLASLVRVPVGLALFGASLVGFCIAAGALAPRHPVVAAIVALVMTEGVAPGVWSKLTYVSVGYHASVIAGMPFGDEGGATLATPPVWVSLAAMLAYAVLPLVLAVAVVDDRDVV